MAEMKNVLIYFLNEHSYCFANKNFREFRILCMVFTTVQIMFGTEKLSENN